MFARLARASASIAQPPLSQAWSSSGINSMGGDCRFYNTWTPAPEGGREEKSAHGCPSVRSIAARMGLTLDHYFNIR